MEEHKMVFAELSPLEASCSSFAAFSPSIGHLMSFSASPLTLAQNHLTTLTPLSLPSTSTNGGVISMSPMDSVFVSPSFLSSPLQSSASTTSQQTEENMSPMQQLMQRSMATPSMDNASPLDESPNSSGNSGTGRLCRICSDKSDGAHFGVDSCRACAAFFRRSIVMKKKYVCRQGGHNCNINKSVRCMCRRCRFVKCLQSGMLPESVQAKPSEGGFSLVSSSSSHAPSAGPSTSSSTDTEPSSSQIGGGVTKLLEIDRNYKVLCALRRSTEMSMSSTDLRGIFESTVQDMRPTTFGALNKMMKTSIPMVADFCANSFPQFAELGQDEKWSVFQNFIASIWNTETIYRTFKVFPHDLTKKAASFTTYIDTNDLETFFSDTTTSMDVKHFTNLVKKNMMDTVLRIVRMLARIDVSELEFAALVGLLMWPPYLPKASERVVEIALSIRESIFRELHVYYTSMLKMEDYAGRLGELMSLYSSLQWSTNRMKEDMEIFKLFDIFSEDSFIYDIIQN